MYEHRARPLCMSIIYIYIYIYNRATTGRSNSPSASTPTRCPSGSEAPPPHPHDPAARPGRRGPADPSFFFFQDWRGAPGRVSTSRPVCRRGQRAWRLHGGPVSPPRRLRQVRLGVGLTSRSAAPGPGATRPWLRQADCTTWIWRGHRGRAWPGAPGLCVGGRPFLVTKLVQSARHGPPADRGCWRDSSRDRD